MNFYYFSIKNINGNTFVPSSSVNSCLQSSFGHSGGLFTYRRGIPCNRKSLRDNETLSANSNLLFLAQDIIGTALAQPVATGRLDRILENKITLRTEVLLPVVRFEDSFVHFVPRHLFKLCGIQITGV